MILFTASWCKYCGVVKEFLDHNPQIQNVRICDIDQDMVTPKDKGVTQLPALWRNDNTLMVESSEIIEYIKENGE